MNESGISQTLRSLASTGQYSYAFLKNDFGVSRGRGLLAFDAMQNRGFLMGYSVYDSTVKQFIDQNTPLYPENSGFAFCVVVQNQNELGLVEEVLRAGGLFSRMEVGRVGDRADAGDEFFSAEISGTILFAAMHGNMWERLSEVVVGVDMNAVATEAGRLVFTTFPADPARRDTGFWFWRRFQGAVNVGFSVTTDQICVSGVTMS